MRFTKKILTMATCAVMACSAVAVSNNGYSNILSANASIITGSTLNKITSTSNSNFDERIVHLTTYYGNTTYDSTGFIVGAHTIATCAHSLYKNGEYADKVIIRFNKNGTSSTLALTVYNFSVHETYETNESSLYDFGVITTQRDLSEYGTFTLNTSYTPSSAHTYMVKGYPGDPNYSSYTDYQCYSTGSLYNKTNDRIRYTASTLEGMSGSPVIYNSQVVAVHVDGGGTDYNTGLRGISWFSDKIS